MSVDNNAVIFKYFSKIINYILEYITIFAYCSISVGIEKINKDHSSKVEIDLSDLYYNQNNLL